MTKKKSPEEILPSGRPTKYKKDFDLQVLKLSILGATDKDIADFFDVVESTINEWKLKYPTFSESIKKGKIEADINVASSLYQKAIGYKAKTQKAFKVREHINGKGSKEKIELVTVEEAYPPDTTAIIFWLKNRQPEKWRDKQEIDHTSKGQPIIVSLGAGVKPDESTD